MPTKGFVIGLIFWALLAYPGLYYLIVVNNQQTARLLIEISMIPLCLALASEAFAACAWWRAQQNLPQVLGD